MHIIPYFGVTIVTSDSHLIWCELQTFYFTVLENFRYLFVVYENAKSIGYVIQCVLLLVKILYIWKRKLFVKLKTMINTTISLDDPIYK